MRKFNSMMVLSDESLNQIVGGNGPAGGGNNNALIKAQGKIVTQQSNLIAKVMTKSGVVAAYVLTQLFIALDRAVFPLMSGGGGYTY